MPKPAAVQRACALALIGALAGCGHSGSSFGLGPAPEPPPSFADRWADERAMAARVALLDATREADMPVSGSATYSGLANVQYAVGFEDGPLFEDALVGDLELRANFATGRITGAMTGWQSEHAGPVAGRLDVSGARISGNGLIGAAAGALISDGWAAGMALEVAGAFVGNEAEAVAGRLQGDVLFTSGAEGRARGEFTAEQ